MLPDIADPCRTLTKLALNMKSDTSGKQEKEQLSRCRTYIMCMVLLFTKLFILKAFKN